MGSIAQQGHFTSRETPHRTWASVKQNPFQRVRIHVFEDRLHGACKVLECFLDVGLVTLESPTLLDLAQLLPRRRDEADHIERIVVADGKGK